jgi:uncharacterized protein (DUF1697 family)
MNMRQGKTRAKFSLEQAASGRGGECVPDYVVLLRAIGPGNAMPMAELRAMCSDLGMENPQTYIASGNLLVRAPQREPRRVAALIERGIRDRFPAVRTDAVVRGAKAWRAYAKGNPFAGHPATVPKMLHLGLANEAPRGDLVETLEARATNGERIRLAGDALWIDYGEIGAGNTKLTPNFINKAFGTPVTQRNLNTVNKLLELVEARR